MRHPEDVYRSHAEPSLPLFEQVSCGGGVDGDTPQDARLAAGGGLANEAPMVRLSAVEGYALGPSTAQKAELGQNQPVAGKPFANYPHDREACGSMCVFCAGICNLERFHAGPHLCETHHVTGMAGASNGAGLQGCGFAPQESGMSTLPLASAQCETGAAKKPLQYSETSAVPVIQARARKSDKQTSHDAAASVRNISKTHNAILRILGSYSGLTDERIETFYFRRHKTFPDVYPKASPSGIRSRRAELVKMGLVCDSGQTAAISTGRRATVWMLSMNGGSK